MRIRVVLSLFVALVTPSSAFAQDTLLLGGQVLSASRDFGAVIGSGPVVGADDIFSGGRFVAIGLSLVLDGRTGAEVYRLPTGALVALDRARPRLFEQRAFGGGRASDEVRVVVP